MPTSLKDTTTLHNGVKMPWVGLGVYKVQEGEEVIQAVKAALKNGYISIDTAALYKNEAGVGQAIKEAGVPREDLFITTKVWNSDQGYDSALQAFETSLNKLGLDYLDLYLIHWPGQDENRRHETWRALEKLYKDGRVRAIGVANFHIPHLEDLISHAEIKPMVNQVEYHPHLNQTALREYCKKEGIQLEAWSPLKRGELLNEPTLMDIAQKYNKSVAQVILRWDLQTGVVTIPKSIKEQRIIANSEIFDFNLTAEDMEKINRLNKDSSIGPNPDEMNRDF